MPNSGLWGPVDAVVFAGLYIGVRKIEVWAPWFARAAAAPDCCESVALARLITCLGSPERAQPKGKAFGRATNARYSGVKPLVLRGGVS